MKVGLFMKSENMIVSFAVGIFTTSFQGEINNKTFLCADIYTILRD